MARRFPRNGGGDHGRPWITRREMLQHAGAGFGTVALTALLAEAAGSRPQSTRSHFQPRAKHVVFLFMGGGPSQVDTFDPKPELDRLHGGRVPDSIAKDIPRIARAPLHDLVKSPFKFQKHGESGIEVSELFPHVARRVDDLCVIRSMRHATPIHAPAEYMALTGSPVGDRPSLGAWVTYGLGSENQNMPAFVVMIANGNTTRDPAWAAGFLPARYQGTRVHPDGIRDAKLPRGYTRDARRKQLDLIGALNRRHLARVGEHSELEARIASYELAFRMQAAAPELFDLSREPESIKRLYGVGQKETDEYGVNCLLARRMIERGVRFVQLRHGKWDQHSNLREKHAEQARSVDQPIAALLTDLKFRGLLEDTLVVWGGEFGRTPTAQGT
ncbi:MAG: DUF1501 domain-containing protein, partial [Planctomycetales bacterium]